MPDLKSELKKLDNLRFDDDDAPPTNNEAPAPNKTRLVFEYFVQNPMSMVTECSEVVGLNESRVAALALQLTNRKLLTRSKHGEQPYRYTATTTEFPNVVEVRRAALIKAHEARKTNAAQRRKQAAKAAKKAVAKAQQVEAPVAQPMTGFNAAMLVGGLTPFQAKAVYDELVKLFGG